MVDSGCIFGSNTERSLPEFGENTRVRILCTFVPDKNMSITKETIDHIASLARLSFSEEEKDVFVEQFQRIVEYVDVIQSLELDDVEPLTHITTTSENVFREDAVRPSLPLEEALANAPKRNESFFKVPKVLG